MVETLLPVLTWLLHAGPDKVQPMVVNSNHSISLDFFERGSWDLGNTDDCWPWAQHWLAMEQGFHPSCPAVEPIFLSLSLQCLPHGAVGKSTRNNVGKGFRRACIK